MQSYLSKENAFRNYEGISTTGYLQMEKISNGRKHKGKFTKVRFEIKFPKKTCVCEYCVVTTCNKIII